MSRFATIIDAILAISFPAMIILVGIASLFPPVRRTKTTPYKFNWNYPFPCAEELEHIEDMVINKGKWTIYEGAKLNPSIGDITYLKRKYCYAASGPIPNQIRLVVYLDCLTRKKQKDKYRHEYKAKWGVYPLYTPQYY